MNTVSFLSRLQNTDLHAVSAESVIRTELNLDYYVALRRFSLWEIEADMPMADLQKSVQDVCERSYFMINPNKEEVNWSVSDWLSSSDHAVSVRLSHRHSQHLNSVAEKMRAFFGLDFERVTRSTIWTLLFKEPIDQDRWMQDVVVLSRQGTGFLAHPITDDVSVLNVVA